MVDQPEKPRAHLYKSFIPWLRSSQKQTWHPRWKNSPGCHMLSEQKIRKNIHYHTEKMTNKLIYYFCNWGDIFCDSTCFCRQPPSAILRGRHGHYGKIFYASLHENVTPNNFTYLTHCCSCYIFVAFIPRNISKLLMSLAFPFREHKIMSGVSVPIVPPMVTALCWLDDQCFMRVGPDFQKFLSDKSSSKLKPVIRIL